MFDILDELPDGNVFDVAELDIEINWDDSSETLEVVAESVALSTTYCVNGAGQIEFTASPSSGLPPDLDCVTGMIDMLPNGDFYLELNECWENGDVDALAAVTDGLSTTVTAGCDCDDGITMTCVTNDCNDLDPCPEARARTCRWSGPPVP